MSQPASGEVYLRIATWNVRKISNEEEKKQNHIQIILNHLDKNDVDIAGLQETKINLEEVREVTKRNTKPFTRKYYLYMIGNEEDDRKSGGVGIILRKLEIEHEDKNLIWCTLETDAGIVNILNLYDNFEYNERDGFYERIHEILCKIPTTQYLYVLGDFNVKVGIKGILDEDNIIGPHGVGKKDTNAIRNRLIQLCSKFRLCITNTYFEIDEEDEKKAMTHQYVHDREIKWSLIDYVLTRFRDLKCVTDTRPKDKIGHSDHVIVVSELTLPHRYFNSPLLHLLLKLGCPKTAVDFFSYFVENVRCTICLNDRGICKLSDDHESISSVSPFLIGIFLEYATNLAFMNIKTTGLNFKVRDKEINNLRGFCFGDSLFIFSQTRDDLQLCLSNLESSFHAFGLSIDCTLEKNKNATSEYPYVKVMNPNSDVSNKSPQLKTIMFKNIHISIKDHIDLKDDITI